MQWFLIVSLFYMQAAQIAHLCYHVHSDAEIHLHSEAGQYPHKHSTDTDGAHHRDCQICQFVSFQQVAPPFALDIYFKIYPRIERRDNPRNVAQSLRYGYSNPTANRGPPAPFA